MIYTYTGRRLDLLNLQPADIDIRDIAHALALCNRFAGHTSQPISVAQHSVNAALLCTGRAVQRQALLHDSSEAYLQDITKWFKATAVMAPYRALEAQVQRLIYGVFGCPPEDDPQVKTADKLLVRYEMLQAWGDRFTVAEIGNAESMKAYPDLTAAEIQLIKSRCGPWEWWTWQRAEREFLDLYEQLTGTLIKDRDRVQYGNWSPVWRGLVERSGR